MLKKLINFKIIILFIFIIYSFTINALADDYNEIITENLSIINESQETTSKPENIPNINSRSAVVIDRNSNTILFGKNESSRKKMASTTKIMTSIIIIENCNLNEIVEVSKKAAGTGGSRLGLKTGDKITIKDLLYGLMLSSGNDAAVALAEYFSGTILDFSNEMNKKAKELGLENTNFETPHGLDSENHYTTAYELAILSNYALNNPTFLNIVGTKKYTVTINGLSKTITNTNELLGNLEGVYGIKTGFTNGANRCLVTACKRNNLDIICIVLGADTKNDRTKDSIKLIDYTFKTFEPVNIQELIETKFNEWQNNNLKNFSIIKGQHQNISLKLTPLEYSIIPVKKELIDNLYFNISCNKTLQSPITYDMPIGNIEVYSSNNTVITKTDILVNCIINKKNVLNYLLELFSSYKKYNIIKF